MIANVITLTNMNRHRDLIAIVSLTVFLAGCSKILPEPNNEANLSDPANQDIAEIATSYADLTLMTPEPVFVNPELAMLCVGATKEMVDHARIDKGPHANCSVKIFMNGLASTAFNYKTTYPVGAVIVKEKNMLGYQSKTDTEWQGTGNGVGGMIKREKGYDESNGDWEYFYFETPSSIESGRMKSCIDCHGKARTTDFVFADWAKNDNDSSYGY